MQPTAAPITQAGTQAQVAAAINQGNALQKQYNTQSGQDVGQYNASVNNVGQTQNALNAYTNSIPNAGTQYGNYLNSAMALSGYNPAGVTNTVNNLNRLQLNAANLSPMTQAGAGNPYGSSGAQIANAYQSEAGNLGQATQGEQGYLTNMNNFLNSAASIANQQTGQQLTSEQLKQQGLTSVYQGALSKMATASQTMNQIETLAQQQGGVTAANATAYVGAYNNFIAAQAQMKSAQAAASIAPSTIAVNQAQAALNQQQQAQIAQAIADKNKASQTKSTSSSQAATTQPKSSGGTSFGSNILSAIKGFATRAV
jgi:hypothetical protein